MALQEDFLAFLDCETTDLTEDRWCVEVGVILEDLRGNEVARHEQKVALQRGVTVDPVAAAVNGYDEAVWAAEATPFWDFVSFMKKHVPFGHVAIPVGHNVEFDRATIARHYAKVFCPLSYHKVDTVGLAAAMRAAGALDVPDLKLQTVCDALGIERQQHRAMTDALAAREVFRRHAALLREGARTDTVPF